MQERVLAGARRRQAAMARRVQQQPTTVTVVLLAALLVAASMPTRTAAAKAAAAAESSGERADVVVEVDAGRELSTFDLRFASITFDIQNFIGFKIYPWTYDWANLQLRAMVTALAPMTVRCGGTWEDGIFWAQGPRTGHRPDPTGRMIPHTLTEEEWVPFVKFMNGINGVDLVVGLNALLRDWSDCDARANETCPGELVWDSRNAASFVRYNREHNFSLWGYELGNEPGVWNWTWRTPIVTPKQHAADYAALRALLETVYAHESGENCSGGSCRLPQPKVVGPDTTWGAVGDEMPDGGRNPIPGKGGPNYDYWNATLQTNPGLDVAAFHYYAIQPGVSPKAT